MPSKKLYLCLLWSLFCFWTVILNAQPAHDKACDAFEINNFDSVTQLIDTASIEPGEEVLTPPLSADCDQGFWCDIGISNSLWFKFQAPSSGAVIIDLCESTYNTQVAAFELNGDCADFANFSPIDANDDPPSNFVCLPNNPDNAFNSQLILRCLTPGETYFFLVDQWSTDGVFIPGSLEIALRQITQNPNPISIFSIDTRPPTCVGGIDGQASLMLTNAVPPIQYQWSTGANTPTVSGLFSGQNVSVTVTDYCGNSVQGVATIPSTTPPDGPTIIKDKLILPAHCGPGYISLDIDGGTPPYDIQWSNGARGAFVWMEKGTYVATVSDACSSPIIITEALFVDGGADAGPDLVLDCGSAQLGVAIPPRHVTIDRSKTYNVDQTIESGILCRHSDGIIAENGLLRVINMANFGINEDFHINAIEVAIVEAIAGDLASESNPAPGTQILECRIFETNSNNLSTANLDIVHTARVNLPDILSPQMFSFPIDFTIPAGKLIVIEIWNPSGLEFGNRFNLGTNTTPTLFNNPTWIRSFDCGIGTPLLMTDIGFDNQTIMNLIQYRDYTGSYSYQWTPTTGLDNPNIYNPLLELDSPQGLLTYTLEVTDENGCLSSSSVAVDASTSGVYSGFAGTLFGGQESCYLSTISATVDQSPSIPISSIQSYVLTQSANLTVVAHSDTPVFDLSTIRFDTLGVPDCGLFTIHSLVHASNADFSPIVFGSSTAAQILAMIDDKDICGDLDVKGATFIVECQLPVLSVLSTLENCGQADANATASTSNGVPPYDYSWSDGQTAAFADGLSAGIYQVTSTDAKGCAVVEQVIINNTNNLSATWSSTDVSCNGGSDGSIDISLSGATGLISYEWNNGSNSEDLNNISADSYSITIKDNDNCTFTIPEIIINQPDAILISPDLITNVSCMGWSDGSISIFSEGGVAPYTYSWSTGNIEKDISGLPAGNYSLTLTDANACVFISEEWTVTEPLALEIISAIIQDAPCNGGSGGTINLSVSGGTPPYTYSWNNGSTFPDLNGISAGTYAVTITDANACSFVSPEYTLTEPEVLELTLSSIFNPSCTGFGDGSIDIDVAGGVSPYQYDWSNGANTDAINNLDPGIYSLTVTDANNCTAQFLNLILSDPSPMHLSGFVSPETSSGSDGSVWVEVTGGFGEYTYVWDNGVEGVDSLTNLAPGVYCVTVTDFNGCTRDFCGEVLFFVEVEDIPVLEKIQLFPNPTSAEVQLHLELAEAREVELEIFNSLGQQLENRTLGKVWSNQFTLDFKGQANGLYFIKVMIDNKLVTRCLIVNK